MKKTIFLALSSLLLITLVIIYWYSQKPRAVHNHASFLIFKNNKALNFSSKKFMEEDVCSLPGQKDPHDLEKIDLHDRIGDIVHVHRSDAQWLHLLNRIGLRPNSAMIFYLNGKRTDNLPTQLIRQDDRALVLIGKNTNITKKIQNVPEVTYIREIGSKSETCK